MPTAPRPRIHAVPRERSRTLRAHGAGDAGRHVVRQPHSRRGVQPVVVPVPGRCARVCLHGEGQDHAAEDS